MIEEELKFSAKGVIFVFCSPVGRRQETAQVTIRKLDLFTLYFHSPLCWKSSPVFVQAQDLLHVVFTQLKVKQLKRNLNILRETAGIFHQKWIFMSFVYHFTNDFKHQNIFEIKKTGEKCFSYSFL